MYRDISALAKTSAVSLLMIAYIVFVVVWRGFSLPAAERGGPAGDLPFIGSGIFQAIGVISFAFVCHHNTFLIYGSLATPTIDRFAIVTRLSTV